jgi:diguanylate cyclase (GGDEF)-like protein/hemerythrin-like metal-binding protein
MMQRLLVLDDDLTIGTTVAMIAETAGFEAMSTTKPEEFFRLLDEWKPSHVALDLVMPEMDGVQVMAQLAARGCRAGIIITSGVGSRVLDAAGRSAVEHGLSIVGTLSKPFAPATLRALLSNSGAIAETSTGIHELVPPTRTDAELGASDLQQALDRKELFLVYQPQVDCRSGQVTGFEALARWRHPRLGVVMPDRFIPIAETSGLIDAITDRVLELGLSWLAAAFPRRSGGSDPSDSSPAEDPDLTLSINMSAASLGDRDFVEDALRACAQHDMEPERVILELTETSAMRDPVATLDQLTRLRMKGFQLSIDDFGTGFSSMLQLARLPFSELKIDKSFVMMAMHSIESRAVVRSVVELGRSFGLRTVAEGVEDGATLEYLRGLGCEVAQGYYIARPMAEDDVAEWVASRPTGVPRQRHPVTPDPGVEPSEAFQWDESFLTGLDEVDQQHKRLVDLINRFGQSLFQAETISNAEIDAVFSELVDYANYHFGDEEAMMAAAGVDQRHIDFHQSEHASFVAEVLHLREHADPTEPESLQPALKFLAHWLAYHILGVDRGMTRQVRAIREGMPPEAAYELERQNGEGAREPLVQALKALFQLLSQRTRQLREVNRELELRIYERTEALSEANRQLATIAITDSLTGIPNRRHALAVLNREWADSLVEARPLACLMIDADHLKPVNDAYGHEAGDEVLRSVAAQVQDSIRTDDIVCRLGGDEFLVILPSTGPEGARELAEKIRQDVASLRVDTGQGEWRGSVSIGIAVRDTSMDGPEDLIRAADDAVYTAKNGGRNRIATTI